MAANPITDAWDDGYNNGLDDILGRAFGIADGYRELNGITEKVGISLYKDLGLDDSPMLVVIASLRDSVRDRGLQRPMVEALFKGLPGNFELRTWVSERTPELLELVPQQDFDADRAGYEADRLERRVGGIRRDLEALAPQLDLPPAYKQLAHQMIDRLDDLNSYKSVHDALHQLQMSVASEFARVAGDQIGESERSASIEVQLEEMQLIIERIRRQFASPAPAPAAIQARDAVMREIKRIRDLVGSMAAAKKETAETAASLLRAMLRQQMSLFDSRLVETSEQIPFDKFAQSIASLPQPAVPKTAAGEDPILLKNVSSGFENVAVRLGNRQSTHRMWQQAEATILNIEELLRGTGREIEIRFHWQNLEQLVTDIAASSADPDVAKLLAISGLERALSDKAEDVRSTEFSQAFTTFTRLARVRFQRADNALLEDCGQIRKLQDPLQLLL